MIDKDIWSTLVTWAPWIRRRARSEVPERDDRCHRELLLGEHAVLMAYGDGSCHRPERGRTAPPTIRQPRVRDR